MKKLLLFLLPIVFVACSSKPAQVKEQPTASEQLLRRVIASVVDSTVTIMDVKDDLYQLVDTMYSHAAYSPDIDTRIGAKSLAMDLTNLFMLVEYFSPEEIQFFEDSVLLKLTAINQVWYVDIPAEESGDYPIMNQTILRHRNNDDKNYITELDVHLQPDSNFVVVFFPEDAIGGGNIMFGKANSTLELDDISFSAKDALKVFERTDSTNYALIFGQELVNAMLSHNNIFIGYVNDDVDKPIDNRLKSCMALLGKFHEQYSDLAD